jgi:prolyl-tRNA editing enzyme YbaK/EbsC (Cys-tRNA(Pro) deacylase)
VHPSALRVQAALADAGLDARVIETAATARTAEDAAATLGTTVGQIVKSLVFMADDTPVLVLTSGSNRVDVAKVASVMDVADVRRATAVEVRDVTGYPVGGVAPIGHARSSRVLCDRDLMAYDEVWAAAGTPDTVFPIPPAALVQITGATVADVAEEQRGAARRS